MSDFEVRYKNSLVDMGIITIYINRTGEVELWCIVQPEGNRSIKIEWAAQHSERIIE